MNIQILSTEHTIDVIKLLQQDKIRFNQIKKELTITSKQLSKIMKALKKEKLINRKVNKKLNTTLSITDKGIKLLEYVTLIEILKWLN